MVDKLEKRQCNGCRLCADICPKHAIKYKRDELTGFDYPCVDYDECVQCGLCLNECTQVNPCRNIDNQEPKVYAAWSNDDEVRLLCTSGGIFYELARTVIENGGESAACAYTWDFRGAFHFLAKTVEDIIPQCGSKHVQSQTIHIYRQVGETLRSGNPVLFVGTPCQVAAMYRYLGSKPDNLYTVDFICNSINSPKAQEHYIDYLEEIFGSKIIFARAKDKRYGWNNFGSSAKFENGTEYYADRNSDARVVGYHQGHLFIRESCKDCQYKQIPRNADITLGDFWGIEPDERNPKMELGTSLVMLNSQKGEKLFYSIGDRISFYEESFEKALKGNPAILKCAISNGNELKAFKALDTERFDKVVEKYRTKTSLFKRLLRKIDEQIKRFIITEDIQ